MDAYHLTSIVTLLLIACVVAMVARWLKQPYTIALVLVGLGVAVTKLTPDIHISHDVTFVLILPPLLFQGAMHMDLSRLKDNWKSISLLAVPGVVFSTLFIGFVLRYVWGIDFMYALLFGALITPTDPISVLAILKQVGAPERLRVILEGESLFNDGTGVVVFSVILGILTGHDHFQFGPTAMKFLMVTGGGTAVGALTGYIVYRILKNIDDHLLEVALTVVLVFGTPLLAESLHCSGIIAVVVAGLITGNYGRLYSMSGKTRETLETFWEVIDFIVNSLLFLVIGIALQEISGGDVRFLWPGLIAGIVVVIASRVMVVYPMVALHNRLPGEKIPQAWSHILFWGGLKGSIPMALVVGLPVIFPHRSFFLAAAFSVVLFSLVIQGLTIKPLVQYLKIME